MSEPVAPATAEAPSAAPSNGLPPLEAAPKTEVPVDQDVFWRVLESLAPEGVTQSIVDEDGTEHRIPTEISGRRQIAVFRELKEILPEDLTGDGIREAMAGGLPAIFGRAISMVEDEGMLGHVNRAMRAAFGDDGKGRGALKDVFADGTEALDLFSIQACVRALAPFVVCLILQLGNGVRHVTKAMVKQTPTM